MAIYECRTFDARGNLKSVVSSKKIIEKLWEENFGGEYNGRKMTPIVVEKKILKKNCSKCSKPFETTSYQKRVCSEECKKPKSQIRFKPDKPCFVCKKMFTPIRFNVKNCSPECRYAHQLKLSRLQNKKNRLLKKKKLKKKKLKGNREQWKKICLTFSTALTLLKKT